MYTLYQQTTPIKDISGNIIGYDTSPVMVPDDFFIQYGLVFDWKQKTVTRDGITYYLDNIIVDDSARIPSPNEWLKTYGNTIKTILYAQGEDLENNPSDNPNIKARIYYNSAKIKKYEIRYAWDENDNIVSETSLAPNKEGAVNYKLVIANADPTQPDFSLVKLYPEDTLVKISDLKKELSALVSTFELLAITKNGNTLSDFTITDNIEIMAEWKGVPVKAHIDIKLEGEDGQYIDTTYSLDMDICTAGNTYAFVGNEIYAKLIEVYPELKSDAQMATMQKFRYKNDIYQSPFELFVLEDVYIDAIISPRIFNIRIENANPEDSEVVDSRSLKVGETLNLTQFQQEGYNVKFVIGSDEYELEFTNEFIINDTIKENFDKYFDKENNSFTLTAVWEQI